MCVCVCVSFQSYVVGHTTHTLANCTLNSVLLHNMTCCHSTLFTETN